MRRIPTYKLKGNEIVGIDIYSSKGKLLIHKGTILSSEVKKTLQELGIKFIFIKDKISNDITIEIFLPHSVKIKAKEAIRNLVEDLYIKREEISLKEVYSSINLIIDVVLSKKNTMVDILDVRLKDDYLFEHSIYVCGLAVLLATKMGFNMMEIKEIAIGALLHDIGKFLLMKKTDNNLDLDDSIYPFHTKLGYKALYNVEDLSYISKAIILMHHEKWNGSGYPFGLNGEELHSAVRLVSVCNAFDNFVFNTIDTDAYNLNLNKAIKYLLEKSYTEFDGEIIDKIKNSVAIFPKGSLVRLNTGEIGIVVEQNSNPLKPTIAIFKEEDGRMEKKCVVDLSYQLNN